MMKLKIKSADEYCNYVLENVSLNFGPVENDNLNRAEILKSIKKYILNVFTLLK